MPATTSNHNAVADVNAIGLNSWGFVAGEK